MFRSKLPLEGNKIILRVRVLVAREIRVHSVDRIVGRQIDIGVRVLGRRAIRWNGDRKLLRVLRSGLGADEGIREKRRLRAGIGKAIRRVPSFKRQCLPFDGGEESPIAGADTAIAGPSSQQFQKSSSSRPATKLDRDEVRSCCSGLAQLLWEPRDRRERRDP